MIRRPPSSTHTDTLFPYTTLCRSAELLPVAYFHVVFTLPAPVAEIAFQNKRAVYAILFRTAAETLRRIAADPRHLGAELGVIAVLHTWGQTLTHHPPVHRVLPGGCPSLDRAGWPASGRGLFPPVTPEECSIGKAGVMPMRIRCVPCLRQK